MMYEPTPAVSAIPGTGTSLPRRILVVDDNSDTCQVSVDSLVNAGYEVESAKDGAAGWGLLQAKVYDLVITDNHMPRMTGMEMIGKLRSARIPVPVIVATGVLPLNVIAHNPWLKPDALLQRPYSKDDLLATVKDVLRTGGAHESPAKKINPEGP